MDRLLFSLFGISLLLGCTVPTAQETPLQEDSLRLPFYIGTASGSDTAGIYYAQMDPATGALHLAGNYPGILNPGFLAHSPDGQHLYAVHAIADERESGISAFARDQATGALFLLNRQSALGRGACYVSVSQDGQHVFLANYGSGSVVMYPRLADGKLGTPAEPIQHEGSSVNPERQEGPHAHYIREGIGGRIYAADLGTDQVFMYQVSEDGQKLVPAEPAFLAMDPGVGPRHVAYHPNGQYLYVMNELAGSVTEFSYDQATHTFSKVETVSSLPEGFDGYNKSADIHVHRNGKFLYASNRGDVNSIAIFSIDPGDGRIQLQKVHDQGIAWPRNFAIDPTGKFLLVANRDEDAIRSFRIDPETGMLTDTGHNIAIPKPICIKFVP